MSDMIRQQAEQLMAELKDLSAESGLGLLAERFNNTVCFGTSFSLEDQVITHLISTQKLNISLFTLDTGRLFPETYQVWNETIRQFDVPIKAYYPDKKQLQHFVTEFGPNAFYNSVQLRKKCCHIRKVAPLKEALENHKVWVTGIRSSHSVNREYFNIVQWDPAHDVIKYNPLLYWTDAEVKKYIQLHQVPYNQLHDKRFLSIGCAPCTRAVEEGEDQRAGRWWWEEENKKECGLHISQS